MKPGQGLKALGTTLVFAGAAIAGLMLSSPRGRADEGEEGNDSRIEQGFHIAPVPLNLDGKNRSLVGLGSYIVNAASDCNACHNAGPGNNQFLPGGNPYASQPKKINPATYLGGGRDFGGFPMPTSPLHIITRNLTPDKTGLLEGGHTFAEFVQIMRTGKDFDHLHPTCTGMPNSSCVPPPFDGNLLQIMPRFNFQDMTDHDLRAIYEYLSAIPCIDTIVPGQPQLRNDCH